MKRSDITFLEGLLGIQAKIAGENGVKIMKFDWDKAAEIIKERFSNHPDLLAEAGLQGDWNYTGGEIFEDGKPTNDECTFLASNWAKPTLILSYDGKEQEEIECFTTDENSRFDETSKWDEHSLKILGIALKNNHMEEIKVEIKKEISIDDYRKLYLDEISKNARLEKEIERLKELVKAQSCYILNV